MDIIRYYLLPNTTANALNSVIKIMNMQRSKNKYTTYASLYPGIFGLKEN